MYSTPGMNSPGDHIRNRISIAIAFPSRIFGMGTMKTYQAIVCVISFPHHGRRNLPITIIIKTIKTSKISSHSSQLSMTPPSARMTVWLI